MYALRTQRIFAHKIKQNNEAKLINSKPLVNGCYRSLHYTRYGTIFIITFLKQFSILRQYFDF